MAMTFWNISRDHKNNKCILCATVFEVLISVHATKSSRKVIFNLLCKGFRKRIKELSLNMKRQTGGFCNS